MHLPTVMTRESVHATLFLCYVATDAQALLLHSPRLIPVSKEVRGLFMGVMHRA